MSNQTPAEQMKYLAKELSQTCQALEDWPKKLLPPEESWRDYRNHLARLIFLIYRVHLLADTMNPVEPGITDTTTNDEE